MTAPLLPGELPELAGMTEAEELFEALGVRLDPGRARLAAAPDPRRFGLAVDALLRERPDASPSERRSALRHALREAHEACAERADLTPFRSGLALVRLGVGADAPPASPRVESRVSSGARRAPRAAARGRAA